MSKTKASLAAVLMGAIFLPPIQLSPTYAALIAGSSSTQSIQSGSVLVFASPAQSFSNTGTAASIAVVGNVAKNFWINNTGTEGVSRYTITITLPKNASVQAFRRCALNVSFVGNNTCASGGVSSFALTPGVAKTFVTTLPSMGFYSFQIVQNKSGTMEVDTLVSASHILGEVSNS